LKEKLQKKQTTLQVDRFCAINFVALFFSVPKIAVARQNQFHLFPELRGWKLSVHERAALI